MNKVVITGSTQGIGLGLAREFAQRGHEVLVSSRDPDRVAQVTHTLGDLPGRVIGLACDTADIDAVQALWDRATGEFGGVDIWINNAGLARTTWPILEVPQAEVETMLRTNMLGTINGCRVAASGMREQGHGKLFNMLGGGSDGEYFPGLGIYGTTKRGLDYFTDSLVKELADSNIVVGKIRPGMVITEAVIREAKANPEVFARSRNTMNVLVDRVETVSPYLVEQVLATDKSGTKIRWLSGGKMGGRFLRNLFSKRPDQFEAFGL